MLKQTARPYLNHIRLLRLDKPIGILLLLWPTLWGLVLAAGGMPPWPIVLVFVLGVVLMRSAGCAINDYADRRFDGHVARTQHRPLAAELMPARYALYWAGGLALAALMLVLPLGGRVVAMSVPAAFLAASYPYTKRFFPLPQAYLGVAFGFGIPMAFVAVVGSVPPAAWCLFAANVAWTLAYDTQYAMVDKPDDLKLGIHTSALFFGRYDAWAVFVFNLLALALWLLVAHLFALHGAFYLGWGVALALVCLHQRWLATGQPALFFKAFLHNNWVGAALFVGLCMGLWYRQV